MSPEDTHRVMVFYMEGLILGVNTKYILFCFLKLFLKGKLVTSEYDWMVSTVVR